MLLRFTCQGGLFLLAQFNNHYNPAAKRGVQGQSDDPLPCLKHHSRDLILGLVKDGTKLSRWWDLAEGTLSAHWFLCSQGYRRFLRRPAASSFFHHQTQTAVNMLAAPTHVPGILCRVARRFKGCSKPTLGTGREMASKVSTNPRPLLRDHGRKRGER